MTSPVLVEGRVSIARLHGKACWHCGAVTRCFVPAGFVVLQGQTRQWQIVSCGCAPAAAQGADRAHSAEFTLPNPASLSDAQQRGAHCVWCGTPLATGAAHDLGPRPVDAHGVSVDWFPRCCRTCWKGHQ